MTDAEREMGDYAFREAVIAATMLRTGCDRGEAEVLVARVADRIVGYTREEVADMHPLPDSGEAPEIA